ncbi:MAG: hypothetical protein U0163_20665 [Gemmatimonadaceae bacterium]
MHCPRTLIDVVRQEVVQLPSPAVMATRPLTSDALSSAIAQRLGTGALAFYDAIAPIVSLGDPWTGDRSRRARYGKETMDGAGDEGAFVNCPMSREEYEDSSTR